MADPARSVSMSSEPRHLELAKLIVGEAPAATFATFRVALELAPMRVFAGSVPEVLPASPRGAPLRACVADLGGALRGRFLILLEPEASQVLAALLPDAAGAASARALAVAMEASLAPRFASLGRKLGLRLNPEVPFQAATRPPPPPNLAVRFELRLRTGGRPAGTLHLVLGCKLVGELAALLTGASGLAATTPEALFEVLAGFVPAGVSAGASPARASAGPTRRGSRGGLGAAPGDFLQALPVTALQDYLRWLYAQGVGDEGLALLTADLPGERREMAFQVFSARVRSMVLAVDPSSPAYQSRLPALQARILEAHTRTVGLGEVPASHAALHVVLRRFLQDTAHEVLELLPLERLAGRGLRRAEAETLIRELSHQDLVRALHGAPEFLREGILGAVGRGGREMWKQDLRAFERTGGPGGQPADPDAPESRLARAAVALVLAKSKEAWAAFERLLAGPRARFGILHLLRPDGEPSPDPVDPDATTVRELLVGWGPGRLRRPKGDCFRESLCALVVEAVRLEERRRAATG